MEIRVLACTALAAAGLAAGCDRSKAELARCQAELTEARVEVTTARRQRDGAQSRANELAARSAQCEAQLAATRSPTRPVLPGGGEHDAPAR